MKKLLNKIDAHFSQFFWFVVALLLWTIETIVSLFFSPRMVIKNLREFPNFLSYLFQRWGHGISKR